MAAATDLWDKAFQSLSPNLQASLNASKTPRRDILRAVLRVAEDKRDMALRKGWRFTNRSGEVILVRDLLEKIVDWVNRFKATGDTIVQYSPTEAALPWAAVRFLLQIAVSEVELFGALVNDLEYIARMLVRYRAFEEVYLRGSQSEMEKTLGNCLVRLYAEVLTHLSYAVTFFKENNIKRLLKSPFRSVDREREKIMRAREEEVDAFAKLVDAGALRACETALVRLSLQTTRELTEEKYNDIVEWLAVTRYRDHHRMLVQSRSRLPDAGQWLLNHSEYQNWQSSSSCSLLLVHGIPGAGKSTLSSVVVDALLESASNTPDHAPFSFFYCANPELILELSQQDPITIILDGLDSVVDTERHILIIALRDILSKADNIVKIFVTSRTSARAAAVPEAEFRIHITSQETDSDMEAFVDYLIDDAVESKRLLEGRLGVGTRAMLRQGLISGAGEMFLWAKLQLKRLVHETIEDDVLAVLRSELPKDIDRLYQDFLSRILSLGAFARNIATKTFSWILFMREPLTPAALLTALSVGESASWTMNQVMATCSAFIVLDTTCDVLRFVHQSAQDFLMRHPLFAAAEAHSILARSCIETCSRGSKLEVNAAVPFRLPIDNFGYYAALWWPYHAEMSRSVDEAVRSAAAAEETTQRVQNFIFDDDWDLTWPFEYWVKCGKSLASGLPQDHAMLPFLEAIPDVDSGFLFLLSMLGLNDVLASSLSCVEGLDVNDRNEPGHTPVYLAARFGHAETIDLLVAHGANINVECGSYGSPLHVACFQGHLAAVKQLLRSGAQQSCGSVFKHALEAAFRGGQEEIAFHIVSEASIIDGDDYEEALWEASHKGFFGVVQHLQHLRHSAPTKDKRERTRQRIRKAVQAGDEGGLRTLLQFSGLDANLAESLPSDAVAIATLHNRKSMVEFLIDQGLSPEVEGILGSPLRAASVLNFQSIVRVLLCKGAKAGAIGKFGDALQAAASNGHTAILKLLLQEGASVNQSSGYFRLPIQAAAYYGHTDTVEVLLDANASIDKIGLFDNALEAAAKGGHHEVIELILRKRPQEPKKLISYGHISFRKEGNERLQVMLKHFALNKHRLQRETGASRCQKRIPAVDKKTILRDIRAEDEFTGFGPESQRNDTIFSGRYARNKGKERSPLIEAASSGRAETVNWMLMHRKALPFSDASMGRAISCAAENGHLSIVKDILRFVANDQNGRVQSTFRSASWDVDTALELVSEHCSGDDYTVLSDMFCVMAGKYSLQVVAREDLLRDFAVICKTGNVKLASAIFESCHREMLSAFVVDGGLQLCALHGNTKLVTFMLSFPALQKLLPLSGEETFVTAAASGAVEIMRILAQHWEPLRCCRQALSRALTVASEHGHLPVVQHLVLDFAADVNAHSPDMGFGTMLQDAGCSVRRTRQHPFIEQPADLMIKSEGGSGTKIQSSSFVDSKDKPARNPKPISPLQAALRGFANRFGPREEMGPETKRIRSKTANQFEQERMIAFLLERGSDPNDLGGQTMTPIQRAAKFCSPLTLDLLISAGADVNATGHGNPHSDYHIIFGPSHMASDFFYGAIYQAARRERAGCLILRRLAAAGAEFPKHTKQQKGLIDCCFSYFSKTIYSDDLPTVEEIFSDGIGATLLFLLSRLPRIRTQSARWTRILHIAACLDDFQSVNLLLSRGTDINASDYYLGSALQAAARHGHLTMAQKLLDEGAQVNQTSGRLGTALRAAILGGHKEVFHLLVNHDADLKIGYGGSPDGETRDTLQLAVQTLSLDITEEVLARGADPTLDVKTETQHPLIFAVDAGSVGMVGLLLRAGASPNVCNRETKSATTASPIHAASYNGQMDILNLLLHSGADVDLEVGDLGTPLAVAASAGRIEIMQKLLSAGAKISGKKNFNGAICSGKAEAVELLLDPGARPNSGDISTACRLEHLDIVELFLDQDYGGKVREAIFNEAYSIIDKISV
ncbi:Ankyrin repeat and KH domain-containing protein 1 [Colletotrichum siamense]|nr:Ankyrin repeat and KH domain-containing protein 1 [Colletotrichum siamense]